MFVQPPDSPAVPMHFSTLMWALVVASATAALSSLVLYVWHRVGPGRLTGPGDPPGVRTVIPETAAAVTFDERGIVESINPAGEALFGVAEGWVGWVHIREILPRIDAEGTRPAAGTVQTVGRHTSGALVAVEVALTRMEIAGRLHHCAVVRDTPTGVGAGGVVLAKA